MLEFLIRCLLVFVCIKAARKLGFDAKEARLLVYQTLAGSGRLLTQSEDPAGLWRSKVTSKGGTTQAAMDVFMAKDIGGVFTAALKAARDRAQQLSH